MKTKLRYEAPMIVDLSAESAVGIDNCYEGGMYAAWCMAGSCPSESQCFHGDKALACYSVGYTACQVATNNSACYGCCFTGSSAKGALPCHCNPGMSAAWSCENGTAAGHNCWTYGGNVSACY